MKFKEKVHTEYISEEVDLRNGNLISRSKNHGEDSKKVMLDRNCKSGVKLVC